MAGAAPNKKLRFMHPHPFFWGLIACALGGAIGTYFVGIEIINPARINSLAAGWDSTASLIGWLFYRRSDWFFPLTRFDALLYPDGTTTILTDSIPILTVFFKAFRSFLPEPFQYFGLWVVCSFSLMGLCGWLLARALGYSMSGALAPAALLTLSPPLWDRVMHHYALTMQWSIVLLFYIYLRSNSRQDGRFSIRWIVLLNLLVIGVHPYLSAMALVLTLSCFLNAAIKGGKNNFAWCLKGILALASGMIVFMYLLGYLSVQEPAEWGFGYYKADVLSAFSAFSPNSTPFNPVGTSVSFSRLLPQMLPDPTMETSAYAGSAALLLLAISLLYFRPGWFHDAARKGQLPLIAGVMALWIFALASPISFGGRAIVPMDWLYGRLGALPGMFRASGRFAWPLAYLLMAYSIMFARYLSPKRAVLILWVLVALQLWDMFPRLQVIRRMNSERAAFQIRPIPLPPLDSKRHAYFMPPFSRCPGAKLAEWRSVFDRLVFAVYDAHLKFNSGRLNRLSREKALKTCEDQSRALSSGNPDPDGIYIFYAIKEPEVAPGMSCVKAEGFWTCQ